VSSTVEKECARTRLVRLEGDCTEEALSASLIGRSVICVTVLDVVVMLDCRVSRAAELAGWRSLMSGPGLVGEVGVKENGGSGTFERSMPGRITGLQ
jgi:hypothetical protein